MRLDLQQSNEACGHASLNVNGLPLAQNATGQGQGALTLFDGVIISASWQFTCSRRQQQMVMKIHSVDGRIVSDVAFSARFQQTNPVRINDVFGAARVKLIHILSAREEYRHFDPELKRDDAVDTKPSTPDVTTSFQDVDAEIAALEELRYQSRHLRQLIRQKEGSVMNRLVESGDKRIQNIRPNALKFCKDLDCIFRVLAYKLSSAETRCREAQDWRSALTCMGEKGDDFDHDALAQIVLDGQEADEQDAYDTMEDDDEDYDVDYYETSARLSMLLVTVEAILTFSFFFFCIIYFIRRRIDGRRSIYIVADEEEQNVRHRGRLTLNDFFHGLLKSHRPVVYHDEDSLGEKGEKGERSEKEALPRWEQPRTKTIADELISLSDAASVVGELVEAADTPTPRGNGTDAPPAYDSQSPW